MSRLLQGLGERAVPLLAPTVITAAGTITTPPVGSSGATYLVVEAQLTYGSGGTTIDVYIQTSLDGGASWIDIMNFHFTTASLNKVSAVVATTALAAAVAPGDGALASNTILSGLLGDLVRAKIVSVGTYAGGTSLRLDAAAKAA